MNAVELSHLKKSGVSHLSRSLYAFFIRPRLERGLFSLTLAEVTAYLENHSAFFPTSSDPRIALMALAELEHEGFIKRKDGENFEGSTLEFPFFSSTIRELPQRPFIMRRDWKPGPAFAQACLFCGLEDRTYTDAQLREFISYWMAKPESRVQTAWERAFAQRLIKYREAKVKQPPKAAVSASGLTAAPLAETSNKPLYQAES
ncbi:MAG TPA: hypothetical protein DCL74_01095 [Succinivibrionaceae bacterium]|nr:hypothetical protein [Succinivibrionaceae bacterium]